MNRKEKGVTSAKNKENKHSDKQTRKIERTRRRRRTTSRRTRKTNRTNEDNKKTEDQEEQTHENKEGETKKNTQKRKCKFGDKKEHEHKNRTILQRKSNCCSDFMHSVLLKKSIYQCYWQHYRRHNHQHKRTQYHFSTTTGAAAWSPIPQKYGILSSLSQLHEANHQTMCK